MLQLEWDAAKIGMTAGEIGDALLHGSPRIKSHGEGDVHSFVIRPVSMKEGEAKIVADRLEKVLRAAPRGNAMKPMSTPAADLSGDWRVEVTYTVGSAAHSLRLKASGNTLAGTHRGRLAESPLKGSVDGSKVDFRSALRHEGQSLPYHFRGMLQDGRMSGDVDLGEYGQAKWTATRG